MAKKKFNFESVSDIQTEPTVDSNNIIKNAKKSLGFSSNIIKLDPNNIDNWIHRDRSDFELGDIEALAKSIKLKGQAQPILVVLANDVFISQKNKNAKYIVIAGYRRWLACLENNLPIDAIIKDVTFEDAIALLDAENEKESVSEYSKGMFYYGLVKSNNIKKDELRLKLSLKPATFSNMLAFGDIPKEIWNAVSDMSKVSSRTASLLRAYVNKDKKNIDVIISLADKIRAGAGEKVLTRLIENSNTKKITSDKEKIIINDSIICSFTDRSINFSKSLKIQDLDNIKLKIKQIIKEHYEK